MSLFVVVEVESKTEAMDRNDECAKLRLSSHVLHCLEVLWEDITKFANVFLLLPFAPGHYREFHRPDLFGQNIALACRIV